MRFVKHLVAGLAMVALGQTAHATLWQMQFSGVNMLYDQSTGTVCTNADTDSGCEVDSLLTVSFLKDGVAFGSPIETSISINAAMGIPAGTNPLVNATHDLTSLGIFNVFIGAGGLATDITSGSVTFSLSGFSMGGSGLSSIFGVPDLPFAIPVEDPVIWSFSSNRALSSVCTDGLCLFEGTGEMRWETVEVPEPASLALLGLGLFGIGIARRRRI